MSRRWSVSFWSVYERNMPPAPVPWSEAWPVLRYCGPRPSHLPFFASDVYVVYIYMLMYKKIRVLTFLHSRTPATASWGS
jgi:hypothetical protein